MCSTSSLKIIDISFLNHKPSNTNTFNMYCFSYLLHRKGILFPVVLPIFAKLGMWFVNFELCPFTASCVFIHDVWSLNKDSLIQKKKTKQQCE